MVIDSSAIIAIMQDEPERQMYIEVISSVNYRNLSGVSFVETSLVLVSRYGAKAMQEIDDFIGKAQIRIRSVDENQALIARIALLEFGKGRHPARFNFGDCFAYALAKGLDQPLSFKGENFSKTDIKLFD